MEQSPRLALSYLQPQQAQKHVTVNETVRRLDALVGLAVKSRTIAAQPGAPSEGDAYIMTASPSGAAWSAYAENAVAAFQDGAWTEIAPAEGLRAYVIDEGALFAFTASGWAQVGGAGGADMLGINAAADATNRLSVKSDAVLFSHDDVTPGSGDVRAKLNKAAPGGTVSMLFQTAFSGRAEMGLAGDDDFRVKVSADGAAWKTAFSSDRTNGFVGLGDITPRGPACVRGRTNGWALQFSATDADSGGYLTSINGSNFFMSSGAAYEGAAWIAKDTAATIIGGSGSAISAYCNAGLTPGASYSVTRTLYLTTAEVSPGGDNVQTCGAAARRYAAVYAASGTINTSDARLKQNDGSLDGRERRAAKRILASIVKYRWRDAVDAKGEKARLHVGVMAQDVAAAFRAEGLDPARYGLWCADEIDGETRYSLRYDEVALFALAGLADAIHSACEK